MSQRIENKVRKLWKNLIERNLEIEEKLYTIEFNSFTYLELEAERKVNLYILDLSKNISFTKKSLDLLCRKLIKENDERNIKRLKLEHFESILDDKITELNNIK